MFEVLWQSLALVYINSIVCLGPSVNPTRWPEAHARLRRTPPKRGATNATPALNCVLSRMQMQ